ncbi:MAG: GNAT family N-acetyltransferase [Gammaproteobacteria bacterium]|nr:GNAT family N-acetyltransferase [Gammaproteobacteria bacterium]
MNLVSGAQTELPPGLYSKVSHYRHQVFVEMLGWQLPVQDGGELDQFDRPDSVYVAAQDDEGNIIGCARLLPTTRPYLLGEVFPQLLNGMPPPCSPDVWELSRFAAVDLQSEDASKRGQFSSHITINLFLESIACAAAHGAKSLITVSPLGVERLLRRGGIHARRAGPPLVIDGHPIFACLIDVEASS